MAYKDLNENKGGKLPFENKQQPVTNSNVIAGINDAEVSETQQTYLLEEDN